MAWMVKPIGTYRLFFNREAIYPGPVLLDIRPVGGGTYWLWFTRTTPLQKNTIGASTGTAFFPYDLLQPVMEALRYEAPVYLQVEPDTDRLQISTEQEVPGEGPRDANTTAQ